MDPIGFSLENFDLVGRWRDNDGAEPHRHQRHAGGRHAASSSPQALRAALLQRKDSFVTAFTEKLLTYALGRRIEYFDQPADPRNRAQRRSAGRSVLRDSCSASSRANRSSSRQRPPPMKSDFGSKPLTPR